MPTPPDPARAATPDVPQDEAGMRDFKAPSPDSTAELVALIDDLASRQHGYGTCVYAVSIAATAAFNLMAKRLGITGFQASCADMDVMRRCRGWKGPAMILDGSNTLYPQYDLRRNLEEWLTSEDMQQWQADEARKMLAEHEYPVSGAVTAHWKALASRRPSAKGE